MGPCSGCRHEAAWSRGHGLWPWGSTGCLVLAAGIGVFFIKPWARACYLWAAAMTIANRLIVFPLHFTAHPAAGRQADALTQLASRIGGVMGDAGMILFNGVVIWFFSRPAITDVFAPSRPQAAS